MGLMDKALDAKEERIVQQRRAEGMREKKVEGRADNIDFNGQRSSVFQPSQGSEQYR